MKLDRLFSFSMLLFFSTIINSYAFDEIKLTPGLSHVDQRLFYPHLVLKKALDATLESDGPFKISYSTETMVRKRALIELIKGDLINVHIAATQDEWEGKTIPICIPILKGLLGYRLLLIHKQDLEKFKNLHSIDNLKKLKAGSGAQWTTTMVLEHSGFNIVKGSNYEGLFGMLNEHRFDYFPRGVNEICSEFDARKETFLNIIIEPTKALYFPTPSYFFVSPEYPILADRIRRGLEIIIQNGVLDKLFEEKYGDAVSRAKLNDREILKMENPFLSNETPFNRHELWFTP